MLSSICKFHVLAPKDFLYCFDSMLLSSSFFLYMKPSRLALVDPFYFASMQAISLDAGDSFIWGNIEKSATAKEMGQWAPTHLNPFQWGVKLGYICPQEIFYSCLFNQNCSDWWFLST